MLHVPDFLQENSLRPSSLPDEGIFSNTQYVSEKTVFYLQLQNLRLKLGVLDDSNGVGTGDTAFVYHNKKIVALYDRNEPCKFAS